MPKAYIVASINVTDPDGYEAYKNGAVKVTKGVGGKLLVSGGRTEAIEGTFHNRIVVIEFESFEAARAAAAVTQPCAIRAALRPPITIRSSSKAYSIERAVSIRR